MEPYIRIRQMVYSQYVRPTTIYPNYGSFNDQVNHTFRVHRVNFQGVLPRYNLSTSKTRDTGLGPLLEDLPVTTYYDIIKGKHKIKGLKVEKHKILPRNKQIEPEKGHYIDIQV